MGFVGIDPGGDGAAAYCDSEGQNIEVFKFKMATVQEMGQEIQELCKGQRVLLERVHSMPGQGVASTFKFGQNFGYCEMALALSQCRYEYVQPTKWQKHYGLAGLKLPSQAEKKRRHKEKAQQLFPDIKITLANCDALLIMEYNRQTAI